MKNLVYSGDQSSIQLTAPADVDGGELVAIGNRVFAAVADVKNGETGAFLKAGVINYAAASEAVAIGDVLYFNNSSNILQKTASTFKKAGTSLTAKNGAGNLDLDLHP